MPSQRSFAPPHYGSNRAPPQHSCSYSAGTPAKKPTPRPEGHTDGRLGYRGTTLCSNLAQFYHAPDVPERPKPVLGCASQRATRLRQIRSDDYALPHNVNRHSGRVYHELLGYPQAHEYLAETEFDEYGMVIGPKVPPNCHLPVKRQNSSCMHNWADTRADQPMKFARTRPWTAQRLR